MATSWTHPILQVEHVHVPEHQSRIDKCCATSSSLFWGEHMICVRMTYPLHRVALASNDKHYLAKLSPHVTTVEVLEHVECLVGESPRLPRTRNLGLDNRSISPF